MMDSFVEAQNNLKRMSYAGCVILSKTRQSHAVRFSFMPMVMKSPGLKPIEVQNARISSAFSTEEGLASPSPLFEGVAGLEVSRSAPSSLHSLVGSEGPQQHHLLATRRTLISEEMFRASPVQIIPTVRLPPHGYTRHSMTSLPPPSCRIAATPLLFLLWNNNYDSRICAAWRSIPS